MARVTYPVSSPYAATSQTSWHIGRFVFRDIPDAYDDTEIVLDLKYDGYPERLAYDLYGKPELWWVFCIRNPSLRYDPVFGLKSGKRIMVPSSRHITALGL